MKLTSLFFGLTISLISFSSLAFNQSHEFHQQSLLMQSQKSNDITDQSTFKPCSNCCSKSFPLGIYYKTSLLQNNYGGGEFSPPSAPTPTTPTFGTKVAFLQVIGGVNAL